ncbi:MAG: PqqD family protein [Propionibacteriaceae bacterium]|nr:PqqD family protein [Propionibacteriaceae bacterium]
MSVWLRLPGDVAAVEMDGVVYVARIPAGPIQVLQGSAGLIWREAHQGDRRGVVERVADRIGADPDIVRADVEEFVELLLAQGLLVEERRE